MNLAAQERIIKRVLKHPMNSIYTEKNKQYIINPYRVFKFNTIVNFENNIKYNIPAYFDKFSTTKYQLYIPTLKEVKAIIKNIESEIGKNNGTDERYVYKLNYDNNCVYVDVRFLRDTLEVMPTVKLYTQHPLMPIYGIDSENNECLICPIRR